MDVIVTVVVPAFASASVLNVPLPPLIVTDAVFPLDEFGRASCRVRVKVPFPRLDEVTVTVETDPAHTGVPALVLKLVTFGLPLTTSLAVFPLETVRLQLEAF